jgi:hypothetical protein
MDRKRILAREEFVNLMRAESVPRNVSEAVMRIATTLTRLAEAQCNGDFPADNGERPTKQCPTCKQGWHPSFFVKDGNCRECRLIAALKAHLAPYKIDPVVNGDPRGAVVKLKVPSGKTNDWGREGICVP